MKFFQQPKNVFELRLYMCGSFSYNLLYEDRKDAEDTAIDTARRLIEEYEIKKDNIRICDTDMGLESITDIISDVFEIVIDEKTITPKKER